MKRRQFIFNSAAASLGAGLSSDVLAALEAMGQVNGDIHAVTGQGADDKLHIFRKHDIIFAEY